ncbi:MAG TPA: DUF5683 domain-containing protein [Flavipsychrobacter sp.]|nr:DUF5683 domain-containing protein [Flavipsychrobacter sp.]
MTGKTPYSFFFLLLTVSIIFFSLQGIAQAVPDTSMKHIFPDSTTNASSNAKIDSLSAQRKANMVTNDTVGATTTKGHFQPNPKKAGMYSAILPGMGQLYNRQYWKVPLVYAGIAVAGYFFENNLHNYQDYHAAYIARISNPYVIDKYTNIYTKDNLNTLQNQYQQWLDLTVLIAGIGYIAQVLDAVTFAYLHDFDVSRDISMRMQPVAFPNGAGVGLVFNFK